MKRLNKVFLFATLILCLILFGCSNNALEHSDIEVELRVTKNLGEEVIFDQVINVQGDSSVLDILMDNLDVETAYGGGFINSIEGLESGFTEKRGNGKQKNDWFYFVNGTMSNIGSGEYILKSGDVVWWDYHSWDDTIFTPVVCGCFPQPFVNGFGNLEPQCTILYGENFKEEAQNLKSYLEQQGVKDIDVGKYGEDDFQMEDKAYIILETSEKVANRPYWQNIIENREKSGLFAKIDHEGITGYDIWGKNTQTYEKEAGAVLVSGQGMGNPCSIWLFTAVEDGTLKELIKEVIEDPACLKNKAGAIYHGGEFIPLPLR